MIRSTAILALAISAVVAGSADAQSIFPGGPRYDGTIKIIKLIGSSCPPGQEGAVFDAAYRAKMKPTQLKEAMSVAIPAPAGAVYLTAEGDGTFRGTDQAAKGMLILDAWLQKLPNSVLNLDFEPNSITETTEEFTFKGKFKNYTFQGCTARIRGSFFKR